MEFSRDEVLVSARSADHGEARHPVAIDLVGEPMSTGFNVKFFLEVLNVVTKPTITMEMGEPLAPCLVRIGERDDVMFIVMPIRLD
jgi:DNA polymerase-3 subunit beta